MNIGLILAGGQGLRVGGDTPKQFLEADGHPVLWYSLHAFEEHSEIDALLLVVPREHLEQTAGQAEAWRFSKLRGVIAGGETRRASSFCGLKAVAEFADPNDIVLIHDAARPLVSPRIITDAIAAARQHGAANTVVPLADSILQTSDGQFMANELRRDSLRAVQTPQSFRLGLALAAHCAAPQDDPSVTDDCGLVARMGLPVALVEGEERNRKITRPEDMEWLRMVLRKDGE